MKKSGPGCAKCPSVPAGSSESLDAFKRRLMRACLKKLDVKEAAANLLLRASLMTKENK